MASPREEVAQELLETCKFGGLDDTVSKEKLTDSKGKSFWNVAFSKDGFVSGSIKVYSERFILLSWNQNQKVFKNVNETKQFVVKNFVDI